jgi:D-alanyl-lipoteichoic acid acyltransferase DltB (MBOAT superfamily)
MLFNSIEFATFFLVFFICYWFLFNKTPRTQNLLIIFSSYLFYSFWDWRFLILIIISSLTDYCIGLYIEQEKNKISKLNALRLSLFVNIGILISFKYFNFFIDNFIILLENFNFSINVTLINLILPVGISFYTFQTLSYTIDIYNGKIKATNDITAFFAFVAFFPQLVAGPIERAKNLIPQFLQKRKFKYKFAVSGARLILIGLFKKMVIADNLALLVDPVYANPIDYVGFPILLATFFFAFQIYCDFSGYSDIAIGLARVLGFNLMKNFNTPYFSKSLTEFWRNWHISLSTWFRDYVYIPLGGSRVYKNKVYVNIMITFLLSGFWHGANWTFIIWGGIHGIGLIFEKIFLSSHINQKNNLIKTFFRITITFSFVCTTWIFFRSNNVLDSIFIINNLFIDTMDYFNYDILSLKFRGLGLKPNDIIFNIFLIFFLIVFEACSKSEKLVNHFNNNRKLRVIYYYLIFILILIYGTQNSANNFIYFQF